MLRKPLPCVNVALYMTAAGIPLQPSRCGICDNTDASAIVAAIPLRVFLYATEAALFERLTHDALQTGYYPAFLRFLPVAQKAEARHLFTELYTRRTELYRRNCNLIIDTAGLDCVAAAQKIAEQSSHFPRT